MTNLDINNLFDTVSDDFDATFLLAFVKCLELTLHLPVVHRADNNLRESNENLMANKERKIYLQVLR